MVRPDSSLSLSPSLKFTQLRWRERATWVGCFDWENCCWACRWLSTYTILQNSHTFHTKHDAHTSHTVYDPKPFCVSQHQNKKTPHRQKPQHHEFHGWFVFRTQTFRCDLSCSSSHWVDWIHAKRHDQASNIWSHKSKIDGSKKRLSRRGSEYVSCFSRYFSL